MDLDTESAAAATLRAAREQAGLTQEQLAELAETSQSAIAMYERGVRQPTWPVLERLIRACGRIPELTTRDDPRIMTLADAARLMIRDGCSDDARWHFYEVLRGVQEHAHPVVLVTAAEPPPTGDARYDALLAAGAEDLCFHHEVRAPEWVFHCSRFLDRLWWVSDLPSARALALVNAPASYRRRGVMIERRDLISV